MMREEIKRRIKEIDNKLECLKELVDSEAFAPKKNKLTEFEQSVRDMIVKELTTEFDYQDSHVTATVSLDDKTAHRLSLGLLELAKKELLEQWDVDMKNEYERGKRDGLTLGYNKATKEYNESVAYHYDNPPYVLCRFGGVCNNPMKDCLNCPMNPVGLNTTTTTSGTCKKED